MIGVVQARDLLAACLGGKPFDPRAYVRKAPIIPDALTALDVLDALRAADVPIALVHDEHGSFEGVVTPADILEAITGSFRADLHEEGPDAVQRADGSWLLSGSMPIDEAAERLGTTLPTNRNYHTVAGLLLAEAQHVPIVGEIIESLGWRFEVVDMDGRRIDKVLAARNDGPRARETSGASTRSGDSRPARFTPVRRPMRRAAPSSRRSSRPRPTSFPIPRVPRSASTSTTSATSTRASRIRRSRRSRRGSRSSKAVSARPVPRPATRRRYWRCCR
jgi:hypothetical protein